MSESTTLLLGVVAGGGLCALWAWLQLLNTVDVTGDAGGDADHDITATQCGVDGCDVCQGVGRGVCRARPDQ